MKKILVVDDDKDILEAIKFMLEDAGYTVAVSENGEYAEALPKNPALLPDLILLDVLLSGKDGRDICRNLKNNEITKKIPIIMLSAHPSAGVTVRKYGANDFIAKPFDIDVLLDTIKKYL